MNDGLSSYTSTTTLIYKLLAQGLADKFEWWVLLYLRGVAPALTSYIPQYFRFHRALNCRKTVDYWTISHTEYHHHSNAPSSHFEECSIYVDVTSRTNNANDPVLIVLQVDNCMEWMTSATCQSHLAKNRWLLHGHCQLLMLLLQTIYHTTHKCAIIGYYFNLYFILGFIHLFNIYSFKTS